MRAALNLAGSDSRPQALVVSHIWDMILSWALKTSFVCRPFEELWEESDVVIAH